MTTETTHRGHEQIVAPERLREILREQGETCYCAPADMDPNDQWDVTGACPEHGPIWHPASGDPHPDDED